MKNAAGKLGMLVLGVVISAAMFSWGQTVGEEKKVNAPRVYELRTYTTLEGRLPALHDRFKNHTMRLFEKHGIRNEMYWIPAEGDRKNDTLIYIVSHESMEAAKKSWDAFRNDPEWHKVRDASEKDGKIVAKVDAVYMNLTDYSPKH